MNNTNTEGRDIYGWAWPNYIRDAVRECVYIEPGHVPNCFSPEGDDFWDAVEAVAKDAAPLLARFGLVCSSDSLEDEDSLCVAGVECLEYWPVFLRDKGRIPRLHVPPVAALVAQVGQLAFAFTLADLMRQTPEQVPLLVSADADGAGLVTLRAADLLRLLEQGAAPLPVGNTKALIEWKRQQVLAFCSEDPETAPPCPWVEGWDFEPPPLEPGHVRVKVYDVDGPRSDRGYYAMMRSEEDDPERLVSPMSGLSVFVEDGTKLDYLDVVDCTRIDRSKFRGVYVRTVLHHKPREP